MAKPTVADIKALTDEELEIHQLAVTAEVAVRIQQKRLGERLVTALVDAQGVGFTDAEIDTVFKQSREKAHKGRRDPDLPTTPPPSGPTTKEPKKLAKGLSEKTTALIAKSSETDAT